MRKYRNQPISIDGMRFDSKKEANRWAQLHLMERAGHIQNLERQKPYHLTVNGQLICKYLADFVYTANGESITEDCKSTITKMHPVYRLKKKLMLAIHGIDIRET